MAGKRSRGSMRRLPSGRWQVRYTGPDGLRRTTGETYRTKADATRVLALIEAEIVRGAWVDPALSRQPFAVYAERWLKERPGLAPRTHELYRALLRLHILPVLGSRDIRDITPAVIRGWRQGLIDGGLGQSTTSKAYRLVRSIFATAVDDEVIVRNPCRIKGASVDRTPERPVLALDEVFRLAGVIEHRYRAMVLLAVFGSLRYGELLGLTRGDLDLAGARLHVRRAVAEVNGSLVVKAPKTAAGTRTVALPRWVSDELVDHLQRYAEPGEDGRLFVGPKGSSPRRSHFSQLWTRARAEADISEAVHFHDLRHTGNQLAAATGASTRELMGRMGHSSMRAALIYQHRTADRDRVIADALNLLVERVEDLVDESDRAS